VDRSIERPRFLLLSLFHNAGDVEKHATGPREAGCGHWMDGARKGKTRSGVRGLKLARVKRLAGNAAMFATL
jgi:hypothetical protein